MMKQVNIQLPLRMMTLLLGLFLSVGAFAQQITVKGHVKDATGALKRLDALTSLFTWD